jgi:hypothetical protein
MVKRALAALLLLAGPAAAAEVPVLNFTNVDSPSHFAARALMEQEMGAEIGDEFVLITEIDLDFDGADEVFAFAYTDWFCGTAGCVPRIYSPDGDGWNEIQIGLNEFINSYPENWSVAPEPQNGHVALVLTESNFATTFVWDGTAYVSTEALGAE